ncbi:hypothetical protein BC938DRAFT_476570, partial [Jimgerdemannia flammicorona]
HWWQRHPHRRRRRRRRLHDQSPQSKRQGCQEVQKACQAAVPAGSRAHPRPPARHRHVPHFKFSEWGKTLGPIFAVKMDSDKWHGRNDREGQTIHNSPDVVRNTWDNLPGPCPDRHPWGDLGGERPIPAHIAQTHQQYHQQNKAREGL